MPLRKCPPDEAQARVAGHPSGGGAVRPGRPVRQMAPSLSSDDRPGARGFRQPGPGDLYRRRAAQPARDPPPTRGRPRGPGSVCSPSIGPPSSRRPSLVSRRRPPRLCLFSRLYRSPRTCPRETKGERYKPGPGGGLPGRRLFYRASLRLVRGRFPRRAVGPSFRFTFAVLAVFNRALVQSHSAMPSPSSRTWPRPGPRSAASPPRMAPIDARSVLLLAGLGIVCTAGAHTLFIRGLREVRAQTASIISSLEPVYGIVLAFWLLGEKPARGRFWAERSSSPPLP